MAKKKDTKAVQKNFNLSTLRSDLNKEYGEGTMIRGTGLKRDPARLPSGVFPVDFMVGGGFPIWGTTCLWGGECIAADSIIRVTTETNGVMHTSKDTTIKRLYERFYGICGGKGRYVRKESEDADYYVMSVDHAQRVLKNEVIDVVHSGLKTCYQVTTGKGKVLVASADHKFLTSNGYIKLQDLAEGDEVFVHDNVRATGRKMDYRRPEVSVKFHPTWREHKVNGCVYKRELVGRAVYEAVMNGYTYDDFIEMLNDPNRESERTDLWVIPEGYNVHHKDNDPTKNDWENLQLLKGEDHNRGHANENIRKLSFVAVLDEIVSILPMGKIDTYDISCQFPFNNFIANGIVVHNSGGKTTLAMSTLGMTGRICWGCFNLTPLCTCSTSSIEMKGVWLDIEGTFDRVWAECVGASPSTYEMVLAEYGEQYANIADNVLQADDCGLLVVDSLAAMVPNAEMEAAAEDDFYALQARMIGRMVRKLKQRMVREKRNGHPVAIIFINQLRMKIGVMFGNPETMPGGHGMRHEFSLLLRCTSKALNKQGADSKFIDDKRKNTGARHTVSIKKEKILTLASSCEYVRVLDNMNEYNFKKGQVADQTIVMNYAKEFDIITKDGDGPGWKYFNHKSPTLKKIEDLWALKPMEYYRTQQEIIKRAKARLAE